MSVLDFAESYDQAVNAGELSDTEDAASERLRIPAIKRWLFWLGYLDSDDGTPRLTKAVEKAIESFRIEANSPQLKDIESTWRRVGSHVLIERENIDSDEPLTYDLDFNTLAGKRAVYLRLCMLGLTDRPLGRVFDSEILSQLLANFRAVASCLGIAIKKRDDLHTCLKIMDQDSLVAAYSNATSLSDIVELKNWPRKKEKLVTKMVTQIAEGVARIELWLRGYGAGFSFRDNARSKGIAVSNLPQALQAFWKDQDSESRPKNFKSDKRPNFQFFQQLQDIGCEPPKRSNLEDALDENIQDSSFRMKLRKSYKSIGGALFDGIKRALSWVFRFFKKVGKALWQKAKNLARILKANALRACRYVVTAMRGFAISTRFLFRNLLAGSNASEAIGYRDFDLDLKIYIDQDGYGSNADRVLNLFVCSTKLLRSSTLLLMRLGRFFVRFAKRAGVALGWLGAIFAMAKLWETLKNSLNHLKEIHDLVELHDQLEKEEGQLTSL